MEQLPIRPPVPVPLTGDEQFHGIDASVADFWRFAMSNLLMNNVRGYLAEFLVARAVGATGPRVEWDAFDIVAPDGTTIEVKSSGYVQAWEQRTVSRIQFTGLKGRVWDSATGLTPEQTYNADVYVFAVNTAQTHDDYAPLDIATWIFHVVPRQVLEELGYRSITLPSLEKVSGGAVGYDGLAAAITAASPHGDGGAAPPGLRA